MIARAQYTNDPRVAQGREAKEAARQQLERAPKCEHTWGCVNDGKHGREELWVCRHCGEREYR